MMRRWSVLVAVLGCRGYHPDLPFEECQPYPLQCASCAFADDAADDTELLRLWRCEADGGRTFDAIRRAAVDEETQTLLEATDTHFYDAETGLRVAAVREWDEQVDVCGRMLEEEWYGEILGPCEPVCEHDPSLQEADPALAACPPVL